MNRFHQRRQELPPNPTMPLIVRRRANPWLLGCLVAGAAVATGCQQPNGQVALPTNPMVGATRVPAPPTGSIGASTGYAPAPYTQGSVGVQPTMGLQTSDLMAQVGAAPVYQYAPAGNYPAANGFAPANNVAPANNSVAAADYAPTPAAALQQASYAEVSPVGSVTPSVPLRPQLRGMAVNDLTPEGQAPYMQAQIQPSAQAPAALQPQPPFQPQVSAGSAGWSGQSAALTPLPSPPANLSPVATQPSSLSPIGGQQDSWNVVGSGVATPSTAPIAREASAASGQSLPWRAPTTAR